MKNHIIKFIAATAVITTATVGTARAEMAEYKLDPVHTQVIFFADHLGFSHSEGEFINFDGGFKFDPDNAEASEVNVTIDTTSISMDDQKWNDHLKNADFLNVEKYPEMTFKSTAIEKTGEKTGTLTGDLTLLGVTKPVTLDVTYNRSGQHPNGNYVAGFSATGEIQRSDFGMSYGLPAIGDTVELRLEVEGIKQESKDANK